MSWFSQFFGLDPKPAPQPQYQQQQSGPNYDAILAAIKAQQEAAAKAAEEQKKRQQQAEYAESVGKAQSAVQSATGTAASQIASADETQRAKDQAAAEARPAVAAGLNYSPEAAQKALYGSIGATSSGTPEVQKKVAPAAIAASEAQNKTGAQANRFTLPKTEGLTFGGGY